MVAVSAIIISCALLFTVVLIRVDAAMDSQTARLVIVHVVTQLVESAMLVIIYVLGLIGAQISRPTDDATTGGTVIVVNGICAFQYANVARSCPAWWNNHLSRAY